MAQAQKILQAIGLEAERVRMLNVSSAMARDFARAVQEMVEAVQAMGLNPLRRAGGNGRPPAQGAQRQTQPPAPEQGSES